MAITMKLAMWATFVITFAHWINTHRWFTAGVLVAMPALAFFQLAFFIAQYRMNYGDAPLPLTPTHGVVVVSPRDALVPGNSCNPSWELYSGETSGKKNDCCVRSEGTRNAEFTADCHSKKDWIRWDDDDIALIEKASCDPPLRLLVIGDSLAAGVGTCLSCTPILPEAIARSLSKALGGRAVYWSCHGEPGASAGWIIRELELHQNKRVQGNESSFEGVPLSEGTSAWRRNTNAELGLATDEKIGENDIRNWRWEHWCRRLNINDQVGQTGKYDVALVLTGPNDLKSMFLPFMLQGNQKKIWKEAQKRGGSYSRELKRVIDVLCAKMKVGLRESLDRARLSVKVVMPENIREKIESSKMPPPCPAVTEKKSEHSLEVNPTHENEMSLPTGERPLVVLPALPAKHLSFFQWRPLKWFGLPLIGLVDKVKLALADAYPSYVLFVESPSSEDISLFEDREGEIWASRQNENVLLDLKDVSRSDCARVKVQMKQYCTEKKIPPSAMVSASASLNEGEKRRQEPKLDERAKGSQQQADRVGQTGSKILSIDQVHPNDCGYDFFGRYIAKAIVKEWNKK